MNTAHTTPSTTFAATGPVSALVDVSGATITISATDRDDVVVQVRPHNPGSSADASLAEQVVVTHADGRLSVRLPRTATSRLRAMFGGGPRADIEIALPTGSAVELKGWGDITIHGTLGVVEIDSAMGDLAIAEVARLRAKTSMGEIRVGRVNGPADLATSAGSIRLDHAGAETTAKTSAGDVSVGEGMGDLRLSTSMGDVRVERAHTAVHAKTSAGDVRVREVRSGAVSLETTYGSIDVGVAEGSAAWLDIDAKHGVVRSELEGTDGPGDAERTVEIHAATGYGDITLRRA